MRIKFKVRLKGMDKAKGMAKDKLRNVLMKSMFKMEELAIMKAPVDIGTLKANISLFPQILANKYFLVSKMPYSVDLEFGNSPRLVKFDVIKKWVKRKKIRTTEEDINAFAVYVQKKIAKEGVNMHPFMRPSLFQVKEIWLPQFAKEERAKD
jgi:hypothetical protein